MIHVTRISRSPLVLNSDLIEHIEANPDTVISLTSGQKIIVLETPAEIVDRVVQFRRSLLLKPRVRTGREFPTREVPEWSGDSEVERPEEAI